MALRIRTLPQLEPTMSEQCNGCDDPFRRCSGFLRRRPLSSSKDTSSSLRTMLSLALLPFLAVLARAATLAIQSPKVAITDLDGKVLRSETLSIDKKLGQPLRVSVTDNLRLSFSVVEKEKGQPVQPHQAFLRFYDPKTEEEGIQPLSVKSDGKTKFDLRMDRAPPSIPPTSANDPIQVSLILGSFKHTSVVYQLFDLLLPPSPPTYPHHDEASYQPLPTIEHTFRPPQKFPPQVISALFSLLVLAPWLVLLGLWSQIPHKLPHLFSPKVLPFILTLGAFEGLLYTYWFQLNLGQVLLYGGLLAIPTLLAGKTALGAIGKWRLGEK